MPKIEELTDCLNSNSASDTTNDEEHNNNDHIDTAIGSDCGGGSLSSRQQRIRRRPSQFLTGEYVQVGFFQEEEEGIGEVTKKKRGPKPRGTEQHCKDVNVRKPSMAKNADKTKNRSRSVLVPILNVNNQALVIDGQNKNMEKVQKPSLLGKFIANLLSANGNVGEVLDLFRLNMPNFAAEHPQLHLELLLQQFIEIWLKYIGEPKENKEKLANQLLELGTLLKETLTEAKLRVTERKQLEAKIGRVLSLAWTRQIDYGQMELGLEDHFNGEWKKKFANELAELLRGIGSS